jgi:sugar phosphate isomerase/epimerase
MLRLSAFADEIGPNIDDQIRVCRANGVYQFELRGVSGKNVLDLDAPLKQEVRRKLADHGMGVACIGSPIGKVAIDRPFSEHMDRFKIAVDMAEFFGAKLIRVFSYYPAGGEGKGPPPARQEVIDRFHQKLEYLGNRDIILVHENEKGIFGDRGEPCLDLMKSVNSPKLRTAFDFANFVQVKDDPAKNWPLLKPYTAHIHIKDARWATGEVVPAGQGDGKLPEILRDAYASGYRGLLSLEPHLKVAGHSHGETGEALFKVAADALKTVCRQVAIPLAL